MWVSSGARALRRFHARREESICHGGTGRRIRGKLAKLLPLFALVALAAPLSEPTRIDEVRVENLWLTHEATVRRELTFTPGDVVTPEAWTLFETRLWNLGVFSRVELNVEEVEGRRVAVVKVEDVFPVAPILFFQFGGGQFYLWLGAMYANLFGRAIQTYAYYQRFGDYNGFHADLMDPRLFNTRAKGKVEVEYLARPRPEFLQLRGAVRLAFEANAPGVIDDQLRFGVSVEGTSDAFGYRAEDTAPPPPASLGLRAGPYLRVGRLDTDRLRFARGFAELRASAGATSDPSAPVWNQVELEAQWFIEWGSRFNLASRLKAGAVYAARPQDRFYLGGLDAVRGYQDSEFRAFSHATVNVELRFVAFDSTWFAVMPVAFVDGGVMLRDTGEVAAVASAGAGLHILIPRIPMYGGRVEVAFPFIPGPMSAAFAPGFNFGVWHFF
jgi:hypothetical protein